MSKKNRELLLVAVAILTGIAVWWLHVYSPRQEMLDELDTGIELAEMKIIGHKKNIKRLKKEIEELKAAVQGDVVDGEEVDGEEVDGALKEDALSRLLMEGRNIEEVNASTQLYFQEFMTEHGVDFKSYKEMTPKKWGNYQVGRLQFQLSTTPQGLSDLLEYFDNLEKAIRIDQLTVNYRRGKDATLIVTLYLGTLFVGDLEK